MNLPISSLRATIASIPVFIVAILAALPNASAHKLFEGNFTGTNPQWKVANTTGNSTITSSGYVGNYTTGNYLTGNDTVLRFTARTGAESINANGLVSTEDAIVASWRINTASAGTQSWTSKMRLLTSTLNNSTNSGGVGYEVMLSGNLTNNARADLSVWECGNFTSSTLVGNVNSVPIIAGWNTIGFQWSGTGVTGNLTLTINNGNSTTVQTAVIPPKFARVYLTSSLSATANGTLSAANRSLYYDDISVDAVWVGDPTVIVPPGTSTIASQASKASLDYEHYISANLTAGNATVNQDNAEALSVATFFQAWGAFAPESSLIVSGNKTATKERARANLSALCEYLFSTKDSTEPGIKSFGLWHANYAMETVRLFRQYEGSLSQGNQTTWLANLKPGIEALLTSNATFVPNAIAQKAQVCELAAQMYRLGNYTTSNTTFSQACSTKARELIASLYQSGQPGQPQYPGYQSGGSSTFPYIASSGPSGFYDSFTTVYLARYYQLARSGGEPCIQVGDPCFEALTMLKDLKDSSKLIQLNGAVEDSACPWFKLPTVQPVWGGFDTAWSPQTVFRNDRAIIAGVTGDALSRSIALYRLFPGSSSPHIDSFVAMYFGAFKPTTPPTPILVENLQEFNKDTYGPIKRVGNWQVSLPGRDFGVVSLTATLSNPSVYGEYTSALRGASLPIIGTTLNSPYRNDSYVMIYEGSGPETARVIDRGWIAKGWTYKPRCISGSNDPQNPAPTNPQADWKHDEVFIIDGDEVFGWMRVAKTGGNATAAIYGPQAQLNFGNSTTMNSTTMNSTTSTSITSGNMTVKLFAYKDRPFSPLPVVNVPESPFQVWAPLGSTTNGSPNMQIYANDPNQFYGYGILASPTASNPKSVVPLTNLPPELIGMKVMDGNATLRTVVYNTSGGNVTLGNATATFNGPGNYTTSNSTNPEFPTFSTPSSPPLGTTVTFQPYQLIVK